MHKVEMGRKKRSHRKREETEKSEVNEEKSMPAEELKRLIKEKEESLNNEEVKAMRTLRDIDEAKMRIKVKKLESEKQDEYKRKAEKELKRARVEYELSKAKCELRREEVERIQESEKESALSFQNLHKKVKDTEAIVENENFRLVELDELRRNLEKMRIASKSIVEEGLAAKNVLATSLVKSAGLCDVMTDKTNGLEKLYRVSAKQKFHLADLTNHLADLEYKMGRINVNLGVKNEELDELRGGSWDSSYQVFNREELCKMDRKTLKETLFSIDYRLELLCRSMMTDPIPRVGEVLKVDIEMNGVDSSRRMIYRRKCFDIINSTVESDFECNGSACVLVLGTPGVGKSAMLMFMLQKYLKAGKCVGYFTTTFRAMIRGSVFFNWNTEEMDVLLADGVDIGDQFAGITIVATSQGMTDYSAVQGRAKTVCIPLWELEELMRVNEIGMYKSAQEVSDLYSKWGGSFQLVLSMSTEESIEKYESTVKTLKVDEMIDE